jgi:hypothetical protein
MKLLEAEELASYGCDADEWLGSIRERQWENRCNPGSDPY